MNLLGLKIPDALFHEGEQPALRLVPHPARHPLEPTARPSHHLLRVLAESQEKERNVVGLKIPDFMFHETPTCVTRPSHRASPLPAAAVGSHGQNQRAAGAHGLCAGRREASDKEPSRALPSLGIALIGF